MVLLRIAPRTESCAAAWSRSRGGKTDDIVIRVEHLSHDQCFVVDVALVEIDKERRLLFRNRSANISAVLACLNRWPLRPGRNWVSGLQRIVIEVERRLTAETIGARFSENLDTAKTKTIVFG